ncbi:hypothetical protein Cme02nite_37360 [Catellatospora methionotrophica]|uniref:Lipoprotein n=1 Tax=Catellatospora methionotrophica TaxID=121620 RepID=A0A8J3LBN7_9ACTN|nr:hypothetical protein [Catellatospora methionotrophica]GIG15404.1 hypothetical protein Cme02nite_37360 [Catellatospora methionotrophica]
MPLHPRRAALLLIPILALTGAASACKSGGDAPSAAPSAVTVLTPSPEAPASAAPPAVPTPTCAEVKDAMVRGLIDPYYAFGKDGAPLTEGMFSGEDGLVLAVQKPCATGDLGGEIGTVTVGTIMSSIVDTTGRYWGVMLCAKPEDRAQCVVHFVLGDRDPIESVSVADRKLTLVYLTRPADAGSAVVSVKRTAVYAVDGSILKEQSHTDEPYTP